MLKPAAALLAFFVCLFVVAPGLNAGAIDSDFRLPDRSARENIFGTPEIERAGGGLTDTGWLSGAMSATAQSSLR